jgi:hypothetical protein
MGSPRPSSPAAPGTSLLSDTFRFHRALRAAGIDAELPVWEAFGHAGLLGKAPEDADRASELKRFVYEHWRSQIGRDQIDGRGGWVSMPV